MKTTLDLPDELLIEAKATAARRRITLRDLVARALERDLRPAPQPRSDDHFIIDDDGWPVLKRDPESKVVVTSEFIRELMDKEGI
jgi:hypothetical protein